MVLRSVNELSFGKISATPRRALPHQILVTIASEESPDGVSRSVRDAPPDDLGTLPVHAAHGLLCADSVQLGGRGDDRGEGGSIRDEASGRIHTWMGNMMRRYEHVYRDEKDVQGAVKRASSSIERRRQDCGDERSGAVLEREARKWNVISDGREMRQRRWSPLITRNLTKKLWYPQPNTEHMPQCKMEVSKSCDAGPKQRSLNLKHSHFGDGC
ncbi:hypothetical protein C8J57DRAFT_1628495 [Mycena rebaudengoi]|nr:hypothetical protein C8J57DRAFT_1628495 [Mycena rebaudengoi]